MRAVIYQRVSTDDQAESGAGLDAQLDACLAHAVRHGWEPAGPYADQGISGAAPLDKRPALIDALAELGKGDVLLVAKRDRLGRDPIAVLMIEKAIERKGCRVVSAAGEGTDNDDPTNVLMRRIVDAFAEYERLVIKARTRAALGAKKRRGERVGQVPYGKRLAEDGVHLIEYPEEVQAMKVMRGMWANGRSYRQIAAAMEGAGVPTKRGGPWSHQSVFEVLNNLQGSDPCPPATSTP